MSNPRAERDSEAGGKKSPASAAAVHAIPTRYAGAHFRSRLEARWAAMFDRIGCSWEYEPFDTDGYIPDFLIQGPSPMLVEIKPAVTLSDFEAHVPAIERALRDTWTHDVLILGASVFPFLSESHNPDHPYAGLLGERMDHPLQDHSGWGWAPGRWHRCEACNQHGVYHELLMWNGRPCGHYSGDSYLGPVNSGNLEQLWGAAGADVQWRPRA